MPVYTFINTKTKKEYTEMMTIAEMETYLEQNQHIKMHLNSYIDKLSRVLTRC